MGTNFYLFTNNKELKNDHFKDGEYEIVDDPNFGYMVHLCKRSGGWKILWQDHNFYHSVSQLKDFYIQHIDSLKIYDEYNEEYSWNNFKNEVIDWDKKYAKDEIDYPEIGKITTPIDHVEIANRVMWSDIKYWHDEDGYDFTDREFS